MSSVMVWVADPSWFWSAGSWTDWETDSRASVIYTPEEGPSGQPDNGTEIRDVVDAPNCIAFPATVTTEHQSRTRTFSFDDATWSWVPGEWSEWVTDGTTSVPATLAECRGTQPDKIVKATHHTSQKCGDDFSTTTTQTTSTDFILDPLTGIWSPGVPVVVNTLDTTPVTTVACDIAVKHAKPITDATALLPDTGAPSLMGGLAGIVLLSPGSFGPGAQPRSVAADATVEARWVRTPRSPGGLACRGSGTRCRRWRSSSSSPTLMPRSRGG